MGVIDKFLDVMKLGGDDDYDDYDDYDDFDDDYDDMPERKSIFRRRDDEDDLDEAPAKAKTQKAAPSRKSPKRKGIGMEVRVIRPTVFEDSFEISGALLDDQTVVLNFEGLENHETQRIIDFVSGTCYAVDGAIRRVSNYIILVIPKNVDISGDMQEILSGALDLPSVYK